MRWSLILGLAGGAVVGFAAGCGYCSTYAWSQRSRIWDPRLPRLEIPVDAAPWLLRPCTHRQAPDDCALLVDGQPIAVEAVSVGACDLSYYDEVATETVIQTLTPGAPLPPGATLTLDCDDPDDSEYDAEYVVYTDGLAPEAPLTLQIRTRGDPAAPPDALDHLELQYTRDDPDLSCTQGDHLEVRIDFAARFLAEGGYVEVVYPNGQVFAFSQPEAEGAALLPASRGLLKFTPVAIDGERGETVVVDAGALPVDPVYIPGCAVDPGPGGPASLAPFAWLALARRRRGAAV
jgi:hypothetical protein